MKKMAKITLVVVCFFTALLGVHYVVSLRSDPETVICEFEVPVEYEVTPKLLPNYPEDQIYVVPDQEMSPDSGLRIPELQDSIAAPGTDILLKNSKIPSPEL
ncbi:hypothetical protein [Dyadobacter aurulentus]|uniref:hypothetical protein n=1 Tax=Dyadobacter sp. UC 10 TaxID=2605428 RepID=UPI0011F371B2|nr:hypothetical protein [Dyadobacter sp. UC 10]KAA0989153.1 hypothetical protein FXO21_02715 [Dyadobacter sp. UC 10]